MVRFAQTYVPRKDQIPQVLPLGSAAEEDTPAASTPTSMTGRIYPNPTNGTARLFMQTGSYGFTVTDAFGRRLREGTFENTTELDMRKYVPGLYFIRVTQASSKEYRVLRLVKE